jgi:HAD superfamily hydrolase (TIGR01509 family)
MGVEGHGPDVADGPTAIRAVLFDLGGTLIDERDYNEWTELAGQLHIDFDPDDLAHAFAEVERETDTPLRVGPVEFWRRTLERASGREVSVAVTERFVEEWGKRRDGSARPLRLFSDARRCLELLAAEHREMGVVSNSHSEESVREILARAGILHHFSCVVSSGSEHVSKPDPEIFRRAVRRMGVRPEESLYVGNLAYTDAQAAAAAGLHSVWLHRDGTGFGDDPPEITSLLEVPIVVRLLERDGPEPPGPTGP